MSDLRSQLLAIREKRQALTPQIVVDEARPEDHPLHHRFEWDDAIAGEAYRRVQAAELIRSVRVTYRKDERRGDRQVRAFVAIRKDNTYEPIEEVIEDDFARQLLLAEYERALREIKTRYGHLKEFIEIARRVLGEEAA